MRLPRLEPGAPHYHALDLGAFLKEDDANDQRGIFLLKIQAWDPDTDRSLSGYLGTNWNSARADSMSDARLIVITDLGLLAKRSLDGSQEVFVQSIHDGDPLPGVKVEVIGRNGLPITAGISIHFVARATSRWSAGRESWLPIALRAR